MTHHVSKNSKKKTIIALGITLLILVLIFGGIFGFAHFVNGAKSKALKTWKQKPPQVTTTLAKSEDWHPSIHTIGQIKAVQAVAISAPFSGPVSEILFTSGQSVKKGQVLFKLDSRELEAQLKQAEAELSIAKTTFSRNTKMRIQRAISQQALDQSQSDFKARQAQLEAIKVSINERTVKAPFSGRIGIRNINLGEFFTAGSSAAQLTKFSPVSINFTISQNNLSKVKIGSKITFTSDTYPNKQFKATISAFNSEVSKDNHALIAQALYTNTDNKHLLYPGMFVDINVILPAIKNVIIVPRTAISYTLYGESVFILTPNTKEGKPQMARYSTFKDGSVQTVSTGKQQYTAKQVPISSGATEQNKVIVKGIKAGDIVVTSGQNKLRSGAATTINNKYNFKTTS